MDRSSDSATVHRASGIPRVSRLPTPRQAQTANFQASRNNVENGTISSNDFSTPSRLPLHRTAISSLPTRTPSQTARVLQSKGFKNHSARTQEDSFEEVSVRQRAENEGLTSLPNSGAPYVPGEVLSNDASQPTTTTKKIRKPRPSLSDRTMETLSQIPPSPSPRRRQSGFFSGESPMRPPPRPPSAMNRSRPSSMIDLTSSSAHNYDRPPFSPTKGAPDALINTTIGTNTYSKRAVSSHVLHSTHLRRKEASAPPKVPRAVLQPLSPINPPRMSPTKSGHPKKPLDGSKTYSYRPSRTKPSTSNLFSGSENETSKEENFSSIKPIKQSSNSLPFRGRVGREKFEISKSPPQVSENTECSNDKLTEDSTSRKPSSSMALRKTIADAKAARRAAGATNPHSLAKPRSIAEHELAPNVLDVDPFSFDLNESNTVNVLRKRVNSARTDGRLNIATLGLEELPREVVHMYDQDAIAASGVTWYESVDLVRLVAADNEIKELHESAFPDVSVDFEPQDDEDNNEYPNRVFARLEAIDLHGNCLRSLPIGFRRLERLASLNLARNQLPKDVLEIVCQIQTLRELRLGMNALQGPLSGTLCCLQALEILDIHDNSISELPPDMSKLSSLKVLNVSGNSLSKLPFEAINMLPLVELDASNNRLSGSLLPSPISRVSTLRKLDVAGNALSSLSDTSVDFTALQTINVSNNRLIALPSVETWKELSSFLMNNNQLSSLPEGFLSLSDLKTVDISNNNFKILDSRIGSMDNLLVLRLGDNPLRERRLLNLELEDLKLELRNRLVASENVSIAETTTGDTKKVLASSETALKAGNWQVKAGVLDRSNTKLSTIGYDDLAAIIDVPIKTLVVHHNILKQIPTAIADIGFSLTTLDMSNNKLGNTVTFLTEFLPLPSLQNLNLTSNVLTSLLPLTEYLQAPNLGILNISFNRLSDLTPLRDTFPSLTKLLASNNAISSLEFEAVRGLHVLDVSSNEIGYLPPKLALLKDDLKTFMVGGNKFRVPGWGVLEKGTEEILSWLRKRIPAGEEGCEEVDSVD